MSILHTVLDDEDTREYASQDYKRATSGMELVCGSEYRIISEFSALIGTLGGERERGQVGTSQRETDEARAISRFRRDMLYKDCRKLEISTHMEHWQELEEGC